MQHPRLPQKEIAQAFNETRSDIPQLVEATAARIESSSRTQSFLEYEYSRSVLGITGFAYKVARSDLYDRHKHQLQGLIIGSHSPFTIQKITLDQWPYHGRVAFVIDPAPRETATFAYEKLPVEIRNLIMALYYANRRPIFVRGSRSTKKESRFRAEPGLEQNVLSPFYVSKQFHIEAQNAFYREHTFVMESPSTAAKFLEDGPFRAPLLTKLDIASWHTQGSTEFMMRLIRANCLKRLTIRVQDEFRFTFVAKSCVMWILARGNSISAVNELVKLVKFGPCYFCAYGGNNAITKAVGQRRCACKAAKEGKDSFRAELCKLLVI